ncbi:hypothetical protein [Actinoplanes sp. NPDC048796]|uniref:hypothetical protein n=1 Tax=unclassified Actinoplanes TaxID=2626549 RepID=UPI00340E4E3B
MITKRLAHLAAVILTVGAGLVATGTAAHADVYALHVQNAAGEECVAAVESPSGSFNHATYKNATVGTKSKSYGCVLQVFWYSTSNEYFGITDRPGGDGTPWTSYRAIHRIRICQSGNTAAGYPGRCSPYMWWNGTLH